MISLAYFLGSLVAAIAVRRRTYLAGTALGAVVSAQTLVAGCLDSSDAGGPDSDTADGADTTDDDVDNSSDEGERDDEANGDSDDDDSAPSDDDQDAAESEVQDGAGEDQDEDEGGDRADESGAQEGDEREEQAGESDDEDGDESEERTEDDESPTEQSGTVDFEVIEMTPSMESGTEFTYIVLAYTDETEPIPGEASLIDETNAVIDSTSYEATSTGGDGFELTYEAPTVEEDTTVGLVIETDHGTIPLGDMRVYPSGTFETGDDAEPEATDA